MSVLLDVNRRPSQHERAFRAMLGASVLVHAALFGAPLVAGRAGAAPERPALARHAHLEDRVAELTLPVRIQGARRDLVARARADRAAGRLSLGEFLLQAGAIDAREEGRAIDLDRARALYAERLADLRDSPLDVRKAIPEVFGDLHYYGRPGRSMADALLEGGGACEPLTHLLVAAVHDMGQPARAELRYYGGETEGGTTHVAPVYAEGSRETDLLTGAASVRSGALVAGADLVDAYAQAHDLDGGPSRSRDGKGAGGGDAPRFPSSMASGYPANAARYPGTVPLYAGRAVQAPGGATGPASVVPAAQPADCAYFVRKAVLDPPSILVSGAGEEGFAGFPVEIRRVPTNGELDRTFAMVEAVERSLAPGGPPADPAERLVALACLTALYETAATDFALSSEPHLSQQADGKRRKSAAEGERALTAVDWDGPEGQRIVGRLSEHFAGRSWLLLVLPGGDVPVLRLLRDPGREDWGRTDALAALVVSPRTRSAGLSLAAALPRRAQIDVMHEVFHAHDHQRPWASSYAIEGAGDGELPRAYRVFRGLAWGLWEGARPQEEILAALLRAAAEERLDRAWVAGLLDYYGRNALALRQLRPGGPALARSLSRWLEEHGFTEIEAYGLARAAATEPT